MLKKTSALFQLFFIIVVLAVIVLVARGAEPEVQSRVTILTAVLGFLAILYQLRLAQKIKAAEFIYSLNDSFHRDPLIENSYRLLKKSRESFQHFSREEVLEMGNYVMFFMIMNYLVQRRLITMRLIDQIFSNKFFLFCNHPSVQEHQLSEVEINAPLIELFVTWYNYRLVHSERLLYSKHCFSNHDMFERLKYGKIRIKLRKNKKLSYYMNLLMRRPNIDIKRGELKESVFRR